MECLIEDFDIAKGHFFPFANRVVRARIIDYIRRVHRRDRLAISSDEGYNEDISAQSGIITEMSIRVCDEELRRKLLAEKIDQFKAELATLGITMDSLVKQSPKHKKLREKYRMTVL